MRLLALTGVTTAAAACTQCPLPQMNITAFMPCLKQPIGEECCVVGRPMVSNPCIKVWLANPMLAPYKAIVERARTACAVEKMADCDSKVAAACPTECGASATVATNMMPTNMMPTNMMPMPTNMMPTNMMMPPPATNMMMPATTMMPGMMMPAGMTADMKMPTIPPEMMGMNPGMRPPQAGGMMMNMNLNMNMNLPMMGGPMGQRPGMACTICPLPTFNVSAFAPCMAQTIGEDCCVMARPMVENPCAKVWLGNPMLASYKSTIMKAAAACKVTQMPECNSAVAMVCPKECGSEKMTPCQARVANQTATCAGKVGCAISQCMPDGSFNPRQCHGSTGYCWCVDKNGNEVDGSRQSPSQGTPNCGEPAKEKTPCQQRAESDAMDCGNKVGCDQTQCNKDGSYMAKQCRGSTGYCWCVDKDGKEVDGSKKGPGAGEVNCAAAAATTPSNCNCPPIECAPGWVKKLKLGTEGCCKENYQCVPPDARGGGMMVDPAMMTMNKKNATMMMDMNNNTTMKNNATMMNGSKPMMNNATMMNSSKPMMNMTRPAATNSKPKGGKKNKPKAKAPTASP